MADRQPPADRPVFTLTLRGEPGWTTPAVVRFRRLLKAMLRQWGFRVLDARELSSGAAAGGEGGPEVTPIAGGRADTVG